MGLVTSLRWHRLRVKMPIVTKVSPIDAMGEETLETKQPLDLEVAPPIGQAIQLNCTSEPHAIHVRAIELPTKRSCCLKIRQTLWWHWVGLTQNSVHKSRCSRTLARMETNRWLAQVLCQTIQVAVVDGRLATDDQLQKWDAEISYLGRKLAGNFTWRGPDDWMVMKYLLLSKTPVCDFVRFFNTYIATDAVTSIYQLPDVYNAPWLDNEHLAVPLRLKQVHHRSQSLLEAYSRIVNMELIVKGAVQMHDQSLFKLVLAFLNIFIAVSQYTYQNRGNIFAD